VFGLAGASGALSLRRVRPHMRAVMIKMMAVLEVLACDVVSVT
jgi:hypothetical protein